MPTGLSSKRMHPFPQLAVVVRFRWHWCRDADGALAGGCSVNDLLSLLSGFGGDGTDGTDVNSDGSVDVNDLLSLLAAYGGP